jgi:ribosomal protein S18 acetylase RimI-like enzyme
VLVEALSFVCTDPKYQGLGAGSVLTQEVIKRASADNMPIYLESTNVAAKMYEKLGFVKVGELSMRIPGQEKDKDAEEAYEETCMIRRPMRTGHTES